MLGGQHSVTHHRPSDWGRKEVNELYRFFRGFLVLDAIL